MQRSIGALPAVLSSKRIWRSHTLHVPSSHRLVAIGQLQVPSHAAPVVHLGCSRAVRGEARSSIKYSMMLVTCHSPGWRHQGYRCVANLKHRQIGHTPGTFWSPDHTGGSVLGMRTCHRKLPLTHIVSAWGGQEGLVGLIHGFVEYVARTWAPNGVL